MVALTFILTMALSAFSYTVSVSKDTLQSVDGFGVSITWSGSEILKLPQVEREKTLGMFFTPQGANMSIIRMRVVAKTESDFQNQIDLCLWAKARGVTQFYATAWDVPSQFLDASQKLLPSRFTEFATYVGNFITDMATAGVDIGWIGIQNEPDNGPKLATFTVDYNKYTVHYYRTKSELRDFSVVLKKLLTDSKMTRVKLLGPECMGWEGSREFTKNQFETPQGIQAMDVIGTHDYWGAERDVDMDPVRMEMAVLAKANNKKIWQTEYSRVDCLPGCTDPCYLPLVAQDPTRIMTEADFNMRDGLEMVNYLYKDFSKANASAWLFWWTHNPNKGCGTAALGIAGMHNSFNGLAILKDDQTFFFPKRFHTLSHYTRFVRPGSFRIKSTTDGESSVHPMAFYDPLKDQVIVVVYNNGIASAPLSVTLPGYTPYGSMQRFQTTKAADSNVVLIESKIIAAGQAYITTLPPQSISTLVYTRTVPLHGINYAHKSIGNPTLSGGSLHYYAVGGEKVLLQLRSLTGALLESKLVEPPVTGEYVWNWRGTTTGIHLIQMRYLDSGRESHFITHP